jgi:membrane protein CcdC involved in cytochrome C biogenesis
MLDPETFAALFMVIAFSYVIPWRVMSYLKFRKLLRGRLVA